MTNPGGDVQSSASAFAGGTSPDADAIASATASAGRHVGVEARAIGNGYGGDATAAARGTTAGTGFVTVDSFADAISYNGVGGNAIATAHGENAGSDPVRVTAVARRAGEPAGVVSATAEGHSSGGADVTVAARIEDTIPSGSSIILTPHDIALHDAVSGSTSGLLSICARTSSRRSATRSRRSARPIPAVVRWPSMSAQSVERRVAMP